MKPTYNRYMTPSVENIPGVNAAAALVILSLTLFRKAREKQILA